MAEPVLDKASISGFFLVPESKNYHGICGRLMAIERDIAGVTEVDHEFAQPWHVDEGPPDVGAGFQRGETGSDKLGRAASGLLAVKKRRQRSRPRAAASVTIRCGKPAIPAEHQFPKWSARPAPLGR